MGKYIEPKYLEKSFTCPYCDTLSSISWNSYDMLKYVNTYTLHNSGSGVTEADLLAISTCASCERYHIWNNGKMIFPRKSGVPMPEENMPESVKDIYLEAMEVYPFSKRASAALLRLAVQLLCKELGEKGKNINDDIGQLVSKGLSVQIQQALDSVRVIGNNAVHPGSIDLDEKSEVAETLFSLLNIIVEQLITQPKKINEIYSNLPQSALDGINKRDGNGN